MVIVECCDWCGGPHPTVVNCEKAQRAKQYRKAVNDVNRMNDKGEIPNVGSIRRWREGERLYAENDFVTMVYVATEDTSKHGLGLHGEDQMCVIYISPIAAAPWSALPNG